MKQNSDIYNDALLIKKALTEGLNEEEQEKLEHLLENKQMSDIYNDISDSTYLKNQFLEYQKYSSSKAYVKFRYRRQNVRRIGIVQKIVVIAAIIIMGVGVALWSFIFKNDDRDSGVAVAWEKNKLEDKVETITLTLSDGNIVDLKDRIGIINHGDSICSISNSRDGLIYTNNLMDIRQKKIQWNTLHIPIKQTYKLKLSDGTLVYLNSDSELRFPVVFAKSERKVYLSGEAYFDVAQNVKSPFIVELNNGLKINVLGTRFNVKAYGDAYVEALLEKGKIKLLRANESAILMPGEVCIYSDSQKKLKIEKPLYTDIYTAWLHNNFVFRQTPVNEVMETLAHWYGFEIIKNKNFDSQLLISGKISRSSPLSEILKAIEKMDNIHFIIKGDKLCISN